MLMEQLLIDDVGNLTFETNSTTNDSGNHSDCKYEAEEFVIEKFYLITIFGTLVALSSIFNNCALVCIFARPAMAASHTFYLLVLAFFDVFVAISFILLFSVQPLFDFTQSLWLYEMWFSYLKEIFTISHVTLTISAYMLVAASAERYMSITLKRTCRMRDRILVTLSVIFFVILTKGVVYLEYVTEYRPNCTGFEKWRLDQSELAQNNIYRTLNMVWFRQIAHIFLPFILLVYLNGSIIIRLKRSLNARSALMELAMGVDQARQRKENIKAATRMLVVLVATYLTANLFNVVITLWEHLDFEYLLEHPRFYSLATDVVSLLTVVVGCVRLPIYYVCNKQIRQEFHNLLTRRCWNRLRTSYKMFIARRTLQSMY